MNDIVQLILNAGTTVVMLAYFIYRDFKFMQKLDSTLDMIGKLLEDRE
jgi:hypothetical protein